MRAFVFTDPALRRDAGRFVWLSVNTEKATNADFLKKFPVQVWPSMYVIDPKTEKVALRWVGGATVPQLQKLFGDAEQAVRGKQTGVDEILARADALYGEGKNAEAAKLYEEALSKAPKDWPRYGRAVESLLFALASTDSHEQCATLARDHYPALKDTPSAANVAASGLDCALSLPEKNEYRKPLVDELERDALDALGSDKAPMAADDRSSLYGTLVDARQSAKDEGGARKLEEKWASFLEKQAAAGKTPDARAVFDSHRVAVYLMLKQPERGLPMLEASERDLPSDYNPPARLAVIYKALKRYDDALAASDRALRKVYGPRKVGVLQTRADIYKEKGDLAKAKETVQEAILFAESLPAGQRSDRQIASLKKKLEGMS
jgi:tetratricopeptide (TPR) repeat protein